jgi:peptidoglycan/xylan/chitin deacetylase (PgdA/CDA1 family)
MLRRMVLRFLFLLQLHRLMRWLHRERVIVLMYHGFAAGSAVPGAPNHEGNHVQAQSFARQMRYLARWHRVIRLEDFVAAAVERQPLPPYPVVLTLDDGYGSVFERAFPILREHGLPAAVFVTTAFVDNREPLWPDRVEYALSSAEPRLVRSTVLGRTLVLDSRSDASRLESLRRLFRELKTVAPEVRSAMIQTLEDELGRWLGRATAPPELYQPLRWEDVRAMLASGLISIGNHTHTHPILSRCSPEEQRREIETAHRLIARATGVASRLFCYPNGGPGDFDDTTKQCLRNLGYVCALTTVPGWNDRDTDLLELRRVAINDRATFDDFRMSLYGGVRGLARDLLQRVRFRRR